MKRLIIIIFALSFLTFSCTTTLKTNNIHTRHGKGNDQFAKPADKKYTKENKGLNKTKKKNHFH